MSLHAFGVRKTSFNTPPCTLMKVVRNNGRFANGHDLHARGFNGNDVIDILQSAFDEKKFSSDDDKSIFRKQVRRDDRIRNAGFVFETEKHEALCGARTLASDHGSSTRNVTTV